MDTHDIEKLKISNPGQTPGYAGPLRAKRYREYERELGNFFLETSEQGIGIYDLVWKARKFRERTADIDIGADLIIDDALRFLDNEGLSCNFPSTASPDVLREYADILLGKKEKTYTLVDRSKKIRATITYEKLE